RGENRAAWARAAEIRAGKINLSPFFFIFKPATSKVVRDEFGFEELALLIDAGCELEDVKSLVFDKLDENIDTLIERVSHIVSAKTDGRGLIDKNIFLVNDGGE
ncbi:DUF3969 family protein, partial [Pseudomonas aeruginosa]|uniref:DUF3969 family protein n=7 Tax=Pseudomonas aeruginosa TaxID=287 RepID=UPI0021F1BCF4